jgi:predicted dehydrogenase
MVEKPIAMKTDEANELIQIADKNDKIIMVGHTFLYNEAVRKAKQYIDSGDLGDIYYILSQRLNLGRVRQDVNAMWNLAPHDISIILYWLNEFPSDIDAKGYTFLQDEIEDVVFMNLVFPSGRAAHIHVSWLDPGKIRKMTIVGSKKMLVYDDVSSDMKLTIYDKGIDKRNIIRDLPEIENFGRFHFLHRTGDIHIPKIDLKEPLDVECRSFIESIINGKNVLTDGRNGKAVVEILETAQNTLDRIRVKNSWGDNEANTGDSMWGAFNVKLHEKSKVCGF